VTPTPDPAAVEKAALRATLRRRRAQAAAADPAAAARAADLAPLERSPAFSLVAGYRPQGSEIDPWPLMARLAAAGARLALPAVTCRDAPLTFRLWTPTDRLAPDALGVPAPAPDSPAVVPDLVIAPLLAFDRQGGRLGQGGGYYDRTLSDLRAAGPVFVLGLAFAAQEVPAVPLEPGDQRLDAILTDLGYIEVE
jgi:5-formyltetrahydrofolate cyclo-ligase